MNDLHDKFSQIYDQYLDKIYRFVFVKVSSEDVAKDLTSETFVRCWNSLNKNDKIDNVQAFLYRIARNLVIDHYRDKAKIQTVSTENLPIVDIKIDLLGSAQLSSDMQNVKLAIAKLNSDYQDVIIWHYLDELSIGEMAQTMKKSEGAVRVMLHRALESLRGELGDDNTNQSA
jgi:RNA polymerase sigma-70 factor (ECF subfamily)